MHISEVINYLSNKIETIRQELNSKGRTSLQDPHTYKTSCELDRLIVIFSKLQRGSNSEEL